MLLNDQQIKTYAESGMITPFEPAKVRTLDNRAAISFGCGGHGYDIRLSPDNVKFPRYGVELDPKDPNGHLYESPRILHSKRGDYVLLPDNSIMLAQTVERFDIPLNVFAIAVGKSTYARVGLVANITPLEAGWEGYLTLELNNNHSGDVRVYLNEGIVQLLFFEVQPAGQGAYTGRYQNQADTMLAGV